MNLLYLYPQETWSAEKCLKVSKEYRRDGLGTRNPKPGMIASSSSSYPEYGQTVRFNGGTIIDGELYQSVCKPLPKIAKGFKFENVLSWGTFIVKG